MIKKAYDLARDAHKNQRRRSGEPYIMHPVAVAEILYKLGMDNECIVGALLHDVVEDTQYDLDYIKQEFGDEVALLVDGVTKLGQIPLSTREEVQAENIRKMFIAMMFVLSSSSFATDFIICVLCSICRLISKGKKVLKHLKFMLLLLTA